MLRQNGRDAVVACVLETHGVFEESIELSRNARGVIEGIRVLSNSPNAISLRLQGAGRAWQVEINNETGEVSIQRS